MQYEERYEENEDIYEFFTCHTWFSDGKNEIFFAYFHFLGLFMTK
jgi:hypothetical protein